MASFGLSPAPFQDPNDPKVQAADADFDGRIRAWLEGNPITANQIDMKDLQSTLELFWQPDGSVLIQDHSITKTQVASQQFAPWAATSTTLPSTPSDGDEFDYVPAAGRRWRFRFNSATSYWDFIGGSPYTQSVTGFTIGALNNIIFYDAPFAGDYSFSALASTSHPTAGQYCAFTIVAGRPFYTISYIAGYSAVEQQSDIEITGLSVGTRTNLGATSSTGTCSLQYASLSVRPLRIH